MGKGKHPDVALMERWQKSPLAFVEDVWGLSSSGDFVKGRSTSYQQREILLAVERGISREAPRRISVASGHGVGKTSCLSWLIIWFLFCHREAQVGATAPTSEQMYDVLWKECKKWIDLMPAPMAKLYDWTTSHIRIRESPEIWFARARTARRESPEAIAGLHGEHVMLCADEASGVPEEIFRTAEGSLTSENILVILISNPTRLTGYFYDTHHGDKEHWQNLSFSSLDSPLVDEEYNTRIKERHGEDSDEYRIRVLGQFPREDAVDDKGYVPLLLREDLRFAQKEHLSKNKFLGVDPSGEGSDKTVWVVRDRFQAMVAATEKVSNEKSIAQKTLSLMEYYAIPPSMVFIDNFGSGANVAQELAYALAKKAIREDEPQSSIMVNAVNVGEKAGGERADDFLNKRAQCYFAVRDWLRSGAELVQNDLWEQLLTLRFRRELSGKIKIMSKEEMRKMGLSSPDCADALMLTFWFGDSSSDEKANVYKPSWGGKSSPAIPSAFRPRWA